MTSPSWNCSGAGSRFRVMLCLLAVSIPKSEFELLFDLQMLEARVECHSSYVSWGS